MPEPDYNKVRDMVTRCLAAWSPGFSKETEVIAHKRLDELWPDVRWTNWKYVIQVTRDAAQYAIDQQSVSGSSGSSGSSEVKVEEEPSSKKKRGRPPKSKVVPEPVDESVENIEQAEVDEKVVIE